MSQRIVKKIDKIIKRKSIKRIQGKPISQFNYKRKT